MPDPAVAAAFAKHQPWITKYELRDTESGGWFDALNDPRIDLFRRCFPEARRILELGSLEGGHTIGLSRLPGVEAVVGLEGRRANLERAMLAKELFAIPNIKFVQVNLEQVRLSDFGRFDVIYCSGLLYHLPEPWRLVEQFTAVAPGVFCGRITPVKRTRKFSLRVTKVFAKPKAEPTTLSAAFRPLHFGQPSVLFAPCSRDTDSRSCICSRTIPSTSTALPSL